MTTDMVMERKPPSAMSAEELLRELGGASCTIGVDWWNGVVTFNARHGRRGSPLASHKLPRRFLQVAVNHLREHHRSTRSNVLVAQERARRGE